MRKQRAFASLSEPELNQVAEWVRAQKYDDVIARIAQPRPEGFGLKVSRKPLQLLFAKVSRLEKINELLTTGKKLSLADLHQIEAGEKSDLSQQAHDAILIATHDIATNDDCNPTQLLALQRLADFPERAAIRAAKEQRTQEKSERDQQMHAHKIALDLRKEALAERNTTVREAHLKLTEHKLANSNSKLKTCAQSAQALTRTGLNSTLGPEGRRGDHLGPIATNWKEVGQRVCKLFGITPEEEARRAELHKTWKDPHARPGIPEEINPVLDDDGLWSVDPAPEPEAEPANPPASGAGAVASKELPDPIAPSTAAPLNTEHSTRGASVPRSSVPLTSADKNESTVNNSASPAPVDPAPRSAEWHSAVLPIGNRQPSTDSNAIPAAPSAHTSETQPNILFDNPQVADSGNEIDAAPSTKNSELKTQNSENLNPAQLAHFQRMAEFYKGAAAHARELLEQFNANRAKLYAENQIENENQNETTEPLT